MAIAVTLLDVDASRRRIRRRYKAVLSGSYTNGTGETIDFTSVRPSSGTKLPFGVGAGRYVPPANPLPSLDNIDVDTVPGGYNVTILPAAASPTLKNFNLRVYSAANTELVSGAYPAVLTANPIEFEVITDKHNG